VGFLFGFVFKKNHLLQVQAVF